jgi:carbon-monoxide dehydrogenase small subunit
MDALQRAFIDNGAVQCGYCTPGMLLSAKALLAQNPSPTEAEIRLALAGNLCRCTGYAAIVKAVKAAAEASGPAASADPAVPAPAPGPGTSPALSSEVPS